MIHEPEITTNSGLAAAALTLGCPPFRPSSIMRINGDSHWAFSGNTPGAEGLGFRDIKAVWPFTEMLAFAAKQPNHPLAYIGIYEYNKARLIDAAKQARNLEVRSAGNKIYVIPI